VKPNILSLKVKANHPIHNASDTLTPIRAIINTIINPSPSPNPAESAELFQYNLKTANRIVVDGETLWNNITQNEDSDFAKALSALSTFPDTIQNALQYLHRLHTDRVGEVQEIIRRNYLYSNKEYIFLIPSESGRLIYTKTKHTVEMQFSSDIFMLCDENDDNAMYCLSQDEELIQVSDPVSKRIVKRGLEGIASYGSGIENEQIICTIDLKITLIFTDMGPEVEAEIQISSRWPQLKYDGPLYAPELVQKPFATDMPDTMVPKDYNDPELMIGMLTHKILISNDVKSLLNSVIELFLHVVKLFDPMVRDVVFSGISVGRTVTAENLGYTLQSYSQILAKVYNLLFDIFKQYPRNEIMGLKGRLSSSLVTTIKDNAKAFAEDPKSFNKISHNSTDEGTIRVINFIVWAAITVIESATDSLLDERDNNNNNDIAASSKEILTFNQSVRMGYESYLLSLFENQLESHPLAKDNFSFFINKLKALTENMKMGESFEEILLLLKAHMSQKRQHPNQESSTVIEPLSLISIDIGKVIVKLVQSKTLADRVFNIIALFLLVSQRARQKLYHQNAYYNEAFLTLETFLNEILFEESEIFNFVGGGNSNFAVDLLKILSTSEMQNAIAAAKFISEHPKLFQNKHSTLETTENNIYIKSQLIRLAFELLKLSLKDLENTRGLQVISSLPENAEINSLGNRTLACEEILTALMAPSDQITYVDSNIIDTISRLLIQPKTSVDVILQEIKDVKAERAATNLILFERDDGPKQVVYAAVRQPSSTLMCFPGVKVERTAKIASFLRNNPAVFAVHGSAIYFAPLQILSIYPNLQQLLRQYGPIPQFLGILVGTGVGTYALRNPNIIPNRVVRLTHTAIGSLAVLIFGLGFDINVELEVHPEQHQLSDLKFWTELAIPAMMSAAVYFIWNAISPIEKERWRRKNHSFRYLIDCAEFISKFMLAAGAFEILSLSIHKSPGFYQLIPIAPAFLVAIGDQTRFREHVNLTLTYAIAANLLYLITKDLTERETNSWDFSTIIIIWGLCLVYAGAQMLRNSLSFMQQYREYTLIISDATNRRINSMQSSPQYLYKDDIRALQDEDNLQERTRLLTRFGTKNISDDYDEDDENNSLPERAQPSAESWPKSAMRSLTWLLDCNRQAQNNNRGNVPHHSKVKDKYQKRAH